MAGGGQGSCLSACPQGTPGCPREPLGPPGAAPSQRSEARGDALGFSLLQEPCSPLSPVFGAEAACFITSPSISDKNRLPRSTRLRSRRYVKAASPAAGSLLLALLVVLCPWCRAHCAVPTVLCPWCCSYCAVPMVLCLWCRAHGAVPTVPCPQCHAHGAMRIVPFLRCCAHGAVPMVPCHGALPPAHPPWWHRAAPFGHRARQQRAPPCALLPRGSAGAELSLATHGAGHEEPSSCAVPWDFASATAAGLL